MESSVAFDVQEEKIGLLEKRVIELQDAVTDLTDALRDTQRYVMKMAQTQALVARHVAQWPYVTIDDSTPTRSTKRTKKGDTDSK